MREDHSDTGDSAQEPVVPAGPFSAAGVIPLARPWTPPDPLLPPGPPPQPRNPLLLQGISAGRAAVHLVLLLAMFAVLITTYSLIEYFASGGAPASPEDIDIGAMIRATIVLGWALCGGGLLITRLSGLRVAALGLASRSLGVDVLLGIPVAIASYGAYLLSFLLMTIFWPEGARQLQENSQRVEAMVPDGGAVSLVLMMVGIAAYEEFVFRGFLVTHLRRITHSWTAAVLLSGALFASLHIGDTVGTQTVATVFPLLFVGVLWSLMLIWRRSLVPGIVGHALFNAVQMLAVKYMSSSGPVQGG